MIFGGLLNVYQSNFIRSGMFFPIHEYFKIKLVSLLVEYNKREFIASITASFCTRVILSLITFPFELSKIKI